MTSSLQTFNSSAFASCPNASCIFLKYNDEGLLLRNLHNLQIYNAVAFLWCVNFVIALGQCTLAGAFSSYYWAFTKPKDIPTFPVTGGFIRALRLVRGLLWILETQVKNEETMPPTDNNTHYWPLGGAEGLHNSLESGQELLNVDQKFIKLFFLYLFVFRLYCKEKINSQLFFQVSHWFACFWCLDSDLDSGHPHYSGVHRPQNQR